jgi:O-antigen/teichoic acid export membrane protein
VGIVKRQSLLNLISGYIGVFFAAINGLILFPWAFPESPEEMGLVRWVISASLLLGAISHLGWPQTIVTYFPRVNPSIHSRIINKGLLASGICLFTLLLVALIIGDPLIDFFMKDHFGSSFWFIFPFAGTYVIFEMYSSQLIHNQNVVLPYWLKDTGRKLLLTILLIAYGLDIISNLEIFLNLLMLGYAFYALLIFTVAKKIKYLSLDQTIVWPKKEMFNYSIVMLMTVGAQMCLGQLDILMIGSFLGLKEVAQYSIAFSFGIVVAMPMKAMNASLRPIISKNVAEENWENLRNIGMRSLNAQWIISSLLFLVVLSVSPWIFNLLPESYQGGQSVLFWVAAAQLVNVSTGPSGLVLVASKKYRWELYANLILILFALIAGALYIPSGGLKGAAQIFFGAVVLYNIVKLVALYWLTGDFWLGMKFFKSFFWFAFPTVLHFLFWDLFFTIDLNHAILILKAPLYSFIEIFLILTWTLVGLYILNLSPDLKKSINRILNIKRK